MTDRELRRIAAYFGALNRRVAETDSLEHSGAIARIVGLTVEADGPAASIGDLCKIYHARGGGHVLAEVEGFKENKVLLMPLGPLTGLGPGDRIVSTGFCLQVGVCEGLRGRVLGALGAPIDGGPPLTPETYYPLDNDPPRPPAAPAHPRRAAHGREGHRRAFDHGGGPAHGHLRGLRRGQELPAGDDRPQRQGGYQRDRPGGGAGP